MSDPKGSVWRKWDLHVHTPSSALNNQYGDPSNETTWGTYVSRLEAAAQEHSIVAIGATDYFTIEGYERLLAYQNQGRLSGILLIPNIEFRVDKVVYREKDATSPKRLNLHVLFSPLVNPKEIREHFLDDLEFVHEQDPFQPAYVRKLKRSNLQDFGSTLQNQHESFRGKDPFTIGCLNAVVNAEKVKEELEDRFRGNYLLVLAEETLPLMDWDGQHHATRKQLLQMSHAVFSSNQKTRAFCLGTTHPAVDDFLKEFKSLKPCLWGSDAHGYGERFLYPDEGRFCWIKGDVTWEGLKQVLYEPTDRVIIQDSCPEPAKSIYTIRGLQIPDAPIRPSLGIARLQLQLNPCLVAVIGGRGSGKTALLDLIGACFPEGRKLSAIPTSFVYRLYVEAPPAGEANSEPVPVRLILASGDEFARRVGGDEASFDAADVVYLTQNHFDEYSSNPDKLNRHIIDLVFEHFSEERREFTTFEDALLAHDHQLEEMSLQIEHLTEEVAARKSTELEQLRVLAGTRKDLETRIQEIEATQGKQADAAKALSDKLDHLRSQNFNIDSAGKLLQEIRHLVETFIDEFAKSAVLVNKGLDLVDIPVVSTKKLKVLPPQLAEVDNVLTIIDHDILQVAAGTEQLKEDLDRTREQMEALEGLDKLLAEQRETLSRVSIETAEIQQRINETSLNEDALAKLIDGRTRTFAEAMSLTAKQRIFLQSIIEKFRAESPEALEGIRFTAVMDLKTYPGYLQNLAVRLDNRSYSEEAAVEMLRPFVDGLQIHLDMGATDDEFLRDAVALRKTVMSLRTKKSVTASDFGNAVFSRFFRVGIAIEYSGKRMADLSMGERAIVLLKVLLALGDSPLLIDQPEEHLDNRFVYDDLTPAFREAKKRRQIIIATHNANLVVNTDAEQLVIAENTAGVLRYVATTLEDLDKRDTVKRILEGGDEAFRKREQRYGYMF